MNKRRTTTSVPEPTQSLHVVSMEELIHKSRAHARLIMARYDGSHDFKHVERVVTMAETIRKTEQAKFLEDDRSKIGEVEQLNSSEVFHDSCPKPDILEDGSRSLYNTSVIQLASWLHDVGDKKYLAAGDNATTMVRSFLLEIGADMGLAQKVQTICTWVSYTNEIKDPDGMCTMIRDFPELAVVQDADRLDALGAIGVGRCFAFGGAKGRSMDESIAHFDEKLLKLEGMMKTETGRRIARARTDRLRLFYEWWLEEQDQCK